MSDPQPPQTPQPPAAEATVSEEKVLYETKSGVAYVTLNNPQRMNSIDMDTAKKFVGYLKQAEAEKKIFAIVIKSTGDKVFSAGFDLNMFKSGFSGQIKDDLLKYGREISTAIYFNKKPVIMQIHGSAVGMGCIMSLSADFRFVAKRENLFFQLPELALKIFPATGPTFNAVNLLGVARAKDMLLTGRKVPYEEFNQWGMITKLCEPDQLADEVKKFLRMLREYPSILLNTTKHAINIMGKRIAKDCYDMENEMAEFYFAGMLSGTFPDEDQLIKKMWDKYGKGML